MPLPNRPDLGTVALTPQARPVDTYVRPAAPRPGLGEQLAGALKSIQPGIDAYIKYKAGGTGTDGDRRKIEEANARLKARVEFTKTELKAVESGDALVSMTEVGQEAYKHTYGERVGEQASAEYETALRESGVLNASNQADVEAFREKWFQDKAATITDPVIRAGFEKTIVPFLGQRQVAEAAKVNENFQDELIAMAGNKLQGAALAEVAAAQQQGRAIDGQSVLNSIAMDDARLTLLSVDGGKLRRSYREALKGLADLDPENGQVYLDMIEGSVALPNGRKVPLSDSDWVAERPAALMKMNHRKAQKYDDDQKAANASLEKEREERLGQAVAALYSGQVLSDADLARASIVLGPKFVDEYNSARTKRNSVVTSDRGIRDYDDPRVFSQNLSKLLRGEMSVDQSASYIMGLNDVGTADRFFGRARGEFATTPLKKLRSLDPSLAVLLDNAADAGKNSGYLASSLGSDPRIVVKAQTSILDGVRSFTEARPEVLDGDPKALKELRDQVQANTQWWQTYAKENQGAETVPEKAPPVDGLPTSIDEPPTSPPPWRKPAANPKPTKP